MSGVVAANVGGLWILDRKIFLPYWSFCLQTRNGRISMLFWACRRWARADSYRETNHLLAAF